MKKILIITVLMAAAFTGYAQDPSAAFQVDATNQGFLMPRIANHTTITSPAEGLQVYNTTTNKVMLWNGTAWVDGLVAANKFVNGTNAADAVYLGGGKVGIGIAKPISDLHVKNTSTDYSEMYVNTTASSSVAFAAFVARSLSSDFSVIAHDDARTLNRHGMVLGGWVELRARDLDESGKGLIISSEKNNSNIVFAVAGSESARITASGNVGIGTSTPGSKLAVVGLPEYADNTAASAALTAGDFYRTADGTVKVVF